MKYLIFLSLIGLSGCGDSSGVEPYYPVQSGNKMEFTDKDLEDLISKYHNQCLDQTKKAEAARRDVCEINYGDLDPEYCAAVEREAVEREINFYDGQASFFKSGFLNCTYETEQCVRNLDLQLSSIMIHCG